MSGNDDQGDGKELRLITEKQAVRYMEMDEECVQRSALVLSVLNLWALLPQSKLIKQ